MHKPALGKNDTAMARLALIVRGADTQQRDLAPESRAESRGLVAIAQGFSAVYDNDHAQLTAELPVYDPLYTCCRRQEGQT